MFGIGVLKRGGAAGGNVHGASTVIVIVNSRLVAVTVT